MIEEVCGTIDGSSSFTEEELSIVLDMKMVEKKNKVTESTKRKLEKENNLVEEKRARIKST